MRKVVAFVALLVGISLSVEISLPLVWHAKGNLIRYVPRTDRYFTGGFLGANVDFISVSLGKYAIILVPEALIWTGMGYQCEEVIFDPRDMHYSLDAGIVLQQDKFRLKFTWYHDCFHEVDRKTEPTIIWNLFELALCPKNFSVQTRLNEFQSEAGFDFKPKIYWQVYFGIFPKLSSPSWFQYKHDLATHFGAELNLSFARFKKFSAEAGFYPEFWHNRKGKVYNRIIGRLSINAYGYGGQFSLFWSYIFSETQPIRPKGRRAIIGVEFLM